MSPGTCTKHSTQIGLECESRPALGKLEEPAGGSSEHLSLLNVPNCSKPSYHTDVTCESRPALSKLGEPAGGSSGPNPSIAFEEALLKAAGTKTTMPYVMTLAACKPAKPAGDSSGRCTEHAVVSEPKPPSTRDQLRAQLNASILMRRQGDLSGCQNNGPAASRPVSQAQKRSLRELMLWSGPRDGT